MPDISSTLRYHCAVIMQALSEHRDRSIYNLSLPHCALVLSFQEKPFVAVERSVRDARTLYGDLRFFRDVAGSVGTTAVGSSPPFASQDLPPVLYLPPPDNPELVGQRGSLLLSLREKSDVGIISSLDSLQTGFTPSSIAEKTLVLRTGDTLPREHLSRFLREQGYRQVSMVVEKGEYSEREWLFDIYPVTEEQALRVEFFGDDLELMRTFDIESQRSIREVGELTLFPAQETSSQSLMIDELLQIAPYTLFCEHAARDGIAAESQLLPYADLITMSHMPVIQGVDSGELPIKGLGIAPEERRSLDDIIPSLRASGKQVLIVLSSRGQAERLGSILFSGGIVAPVIERHDIAHFEGNVCITIGKLSSGFHLPGLLLLTDRDIFGERPSHRPLTQSKVSRLLLTLDDLKPGDFVVHRDHGIGRFIGLRRQLTEGVEEDLIVVEYAQGDRVYIPFGGMHRLQKYSAGDGSTPPIDKLGGKSWQKTTQKARKSIRDMAEKLLRLYAERSLSRGFVFSEDTAMHREFDDFFPYEETPDQVRAITEIKRHMLSERPMDMLLCGDVGYGKTEVAIKAAFRAVYDGKQVAVLVPTTLLAEQHSRTFRTRFSGFPVTIDYLSRFRSREEIKDCRQRLAKGEIDIMIGTHMLLGKDWQFHDLGLLIIDEEHRFGVIHKEQLKELSRNLDVLTLTATPIPRTLHFSLSGIREICIIETPPEDRLAVKSFIATMDPALITEAIRRELRRDGQVFYVHNLIYDIEERALFVKKLVPEARIATAHGRMPERMLERIMLDFLDHKIDILVCTSIIGSGLDIPSANTLLIERADSFGLADLHQLRGRVGRGTEQAYSYFLIPGEDFLTDDARKRIQAIQEMSYLGAGFRLAMKDLEIRGAGNLLGHEQSGHIHKIGFDMYQEILEKTVAELKGEDMAEETDPVVTLSIPAYLPEEYIADPTLRLSIYKRLSAMKSLQQLSDLREEIMDRFGRPSEPVETILHVVKIKLLAKALHMKKVTGKDRVFLFMLDYEKRDRVPPGFFDTFVKVMLPDSTVVKSLRKARIRLLPQGFEITFRHAEPRNDLGEIERFLEMIGNTVNERLISSSSQR